MATNLLIPSVEERLRGVMEMRRRNLREHILGEDERRYPTVTLTREFGCEGYPVALKLQSLLEQRSRQEWVVMDRALLDAVARDHDLSAQILHDIGTKNRFLDDLLSTFSSRWKSDKDYYRLLCNQIVALAQEGNVILIGRGAPLLTQGIGNCFHFRLVAPMRFKVESISSRMKLSADEAQDLIRTRQRQRDAFLKDFLGGDIAEPTLYHLIFNNSRVPADRIAAFMAEIILPGELSK